MNTGKHKVKPISDFKLLEVPTRLGNNKLDKKNLKNKLVKDIEKISKLQTKLYAENQRSLLIIFQGMDSAGKDGSIKHIMRGVNPQGVSVTSFKHPTATELDHDYLWRHTQELPKHGVIAIFNRSHYENVLISKVHPQIVLAERLPGIDHIKKMDDHFWNMRYKQINSFEKRIIENGTSIVKIFLHLSKKEQCKRFIDRIEHKEKHWKFSSEDIVERKFWNHYQSAYEQALKHTITKIAPWYIVPADDKLYAHVLIGKIILKQLEEINPCFPPDTISEKELMRKAKQKLIKENKH